jgi:hypothetical protein
MFYEPSTSATDKVIDPPIWGEVDYDDNDDSLT